MGISNKPRYYNKVVVKNDLNIILKSKGRRTIGIILNQSNENKIIISITVIIKKRREDPCILKTTLNVIAKRKNANNAQNLSRIFF